MQEIHLPFYQSSFIMKNNIFTLLTSLLNVQLFISYNGWFITVELHQVHTELFVKKKKVHTELD